MIRPPTLLSRGLDPLLAVVTGVLAYRLSETNPRSEIAPGQSLQELVHWRFNLWKENKRKVADHDDEGWEALAAKLEKEK